MFNALIKRLKKKNKKHIHYSTKANLDRGQLTYQHVVWEEAGVPGGNQHRHRENMQIPGR